MAEAAGPSTSNPLPELVPFPYLWHDVAEAALRNRFNLHLQEEFIHPDIHPRYITPDESRDRRFEQLLRTIAGIRQRTPPGQRSPIIIVVQDELGVLELRTRLMATQWRSGSVFAFHDVSHYGRCDEALNAFKEGFFHILVMTEEEGISHFHAPCRAVVWYDSPSFALSFFRFYGPAREIHWLVRPFHDWPVLAGLILLYHQNRYYAPMWLTFVFRECCRQTGNGDHIIQPARNNPGSILEKVNEEDYDSFFSGVSLIDAIIKSIHRSIVWSMHKKGDVIPRIPPARDIPDDVVALMS